MATAQISATNDELGVARPPVVLRLGGGLVIACGDEGAVDDPRPPTISIDGRLEEPGETRDQVDQDPVRL